MGAEGESMNVRISQAKGQRIFTLKSVLHIFLWYLCECPKNIFGFFLFTNDECSTKQLYENKIIEEDGTKKWNSLQKQLI